MFCFRSGWLVALFLCLASCTFETSQRGLYPIDSLITTQVRTLTDSRASLSKLAIVGRHADDSTFTPGDSAGWSRELDIFRQLNSLNKPVNKGLYLVDDGLFDPGSNLTVKAFSALKDQEVRYLKVYYTEDPLTPRKIEGLYENRNTLSRTARLFTMEFEQVNEKTILTSYGISGGQKMIFSDTVAFSISGRIVID